MRRGFEDERLLRKRFSASLMGLRGVASNALNAAYSSGSERAKAIRGKQFMDFNPSIPPNKQVSLGPPLFINITRMALWALWKCCPAEWAANIRHFP